MIKNFGHRGASKYAPENTLASFYRSIELGIDGIETDLKRSKDGVIFIFHDDILERTTNGSGKPEDHTWEELRKLDAGSWYSPIFAGERLISLQTFLEHFARRPLWFVLELKASGLEEDTLKLVYEHRIERQVTFTSFEYDRVSKVRALDPDIHIGYLVPKIDDHTLQQVLAIRAQQICPAADQLEPEDVRRAKSLGLEVRAWKAKNEQLVEHCIACGVDGMTCDFPDVLRDSLIKHGIR